MLNTSALLLPSALYFFPKGVMYLWFGMLYLVLGIDIWDGVLVFGISDEGLDILDGVFENLNLTIFIVYICNTTNMYQKDSMKN